MIHHGNFDEPRQRFYRCLQLYLPYSFTWWWCSSMLVGLLLSPFNCRLEHLVGICCLPLVQKNCIPGTYVTVKKTKKPKPKKTQLSSSFRHILCAKVLVLVTFPLCCEWYFQKAYGETAGFYKI